uniref:EGF-like domain-containing protein n=1 Tax=Magallana gigas TaxID=29159 RepID=K1PKN4_MAGGI
MNIRGGESSTVPLLSALLLFTNGCLSIACNDTHYGTGCNQLCPCITTNTADCDDTFGICTCLPNWTRENCTVDVDERGSTVVEHEVTMNKTEEANQDLVEAVFSLSDGESKIKYKNEILTTSSVAVSDASGKQQGTQIVDASDNFQLIVGLGVGISLFVLAVLIGTITVYFVRGKPNPVVLSNNDYIENTYSEGDMYIVMGRLTKVDSLDRYGSEFSHWSGHRGERGRGDFDDVSRDDFKLIVGLGVGIPLFILAVLIAIIIVFFVRRKRHPREMSISSSDENFE